MRCVYSILLLITLHINTVTACEECCKEDQPLECAYKTPEERKTISLCACVPTVTVADGTRVDMYCRMSGRKYTSNGKFTPCFAYDTICDETKLEIFCYHGYPPSSAIYGSTSDYCKFETNEKPADVYNIFFTCWLYDCEHRLKKPEKAVERGTLEMSWCYPPLIKDPSLKYCDKYTLDANNNEVYYDYSASVKQLPTEKKKLCVLLPFCGGDGKVDSAFMPTNYNNDGKANEKHCERLCRGDGDNNGTEDGEPCRVIPSCLFQNGTNGPNKPDPMYNKFLVHTCNPWCSEEDSYVRSSSRGLRINQYPGLEDDKRCNPLPFCVDGKVPKPLYGPSNPYASLVCIPPRECTVPETPETHICTEKPEVTVGMEIEDGLSTMVIVGIVISIVVLVVLIGIVITIVLCYRRRKANMPIVDQTGPPPPAFTDGKQNTDETVSKDANKPTEKKSATSVKSETKRSLKSLKNVNQFNKENESAKDASSKKKE